MFSKARSDQRGQCINDIESYPDVLNS